MIMWIIVTWKRNVNRQYLVRPESDETHPQVYVTRIRGYNYFLTIQGISFCDAENHNSLIQVIQVQTI